MSTSAGSLSFDAARQSMDVLARPSGRLCRSLGSGHRSSRSQAVSARSGRDPAPDPGRADQGRPRVPLAVSRLPKRIFEYFAEFPELVAGPCSLRPDLRRVPHPQAERRGGERRGVSARIPRPHGRDRLDSQHRARPTRPRRSTIAHKEQRVEGIAAGDTIDDFELLAELGAGAFAKVFLARQKSMQRLVASRSRADQGTEPQTLAQLDHDHIVRVFDQRLIPGTEVATAVHAVRRRRNAPGRRTTRAADPARKTNRKTSAGRRRRDTRTARRIPTG